MYWKISLGSTPDPSSNRLCTPNSGMNQDAISNSRISFPRSSCETVRRRSGRRPKNPKTAPDQQPSKESSSTASTRRLKRTPGTGKLRPNHSHGPTWKTQLSHLLPHTSRRMPGSLNLHRSPRPVRSSPPPTTVDFKNKPLDTLAS